jgi:hypothetical protein
MQTVQTHQRERELLLCCATVHGSRQHSDKIRDLIGKGIDWSYLCRLAKRNGTTPLLYRNLRHAVRHLVPSNIIDELRRRFLANLTRNEILARHLTKIVDRFENCGITVIPYKGPALAVLAYGDVSMREFCDLDFLVRREDVLRAKSLLLADGYRPEEDLSPLEEEAYLKHECEFNLCHSDRKISVELHWEILPRYYSCPIEVGEFWKQLHPVELSGKTVATLSPENQLLVLCLHHGGKHQWEKLSLVSDIAQLVITQKDMDWEKVAHLVARSGVDRMLLFSLYLAKHLLSAKLPAFIEDRVSMDESLMPLIKETEKRIFDLDGIPMTEMDRLFFFLRTRERARDKWRSLAGRLLTPTVNDWSFIRLPPALHPCYRIVRPFRLAREAARIRLMDE